MYIHRRIKCYNCYVPFKKTIQTILFIRVTILVGKYGLAWRWQARLVANALGPGLSAAGDLNLLQSEYIKNRLCVLSERRSSSPGKKLAESVQRSEYIFCSISGLSVLRRCHICIFFANLTTTEAGNSACIHRDR
jgi:hypothetical protein